MLFWYTTKQDSSNLFYLVCVCYPNIIQCVKLVIVHLEMFLDIDLHLLELKFIKTAGELFDRQKKSAWRILSWKNDRYKNNKK